jgi:hypothetical protein
MKKQRGVLVETEDGQRGVYYPDQETIKGKYPVTMLNKELKPIMQDGKPLKKLFHSEGLRAIGFID